MTNEPVYRYVIELENEKYATFEQIAIEEVMVFGEESVFNAEFIKNEREANTIFKSMSDSVDGKGEWTLYGECIKPKVIRKIKIEMVE